MCKRLIPFLSRALLLACMVVGGGAYAADAGPAIKPGDTPVLPALTTLDGKGITPASWRGKVIDRAASIRGKSRTDFMIDAAYRAAEDALLDQTLVRVDEDSYRHYLSLLDQPPGGEGFERLMNARRPWQA